MWSFVISILFLIENVNTLVPIGANMDGLADWSRSRPYVNLIRQSRRWGSPDSPWDGSATFDPTNGWPTQDFGVVTATDNIDLGGEYLLSAKGNAEISFTASTGYITDKTYDPTTNIMTAIVHVPQGADQTFLSFRNTTGPGLQDLVFLQQGYNLASKDNFTKLMLAHLSRFSIIRFMDWTDTNGNFEHDWNDTTPVDWPEYAPKHNPWETIAHLANSIGKPIDIWVNIPHNATDDYILHVARILFSELNPENKIYLEYSNEVWNWIFPQATANLHAANDSVLNHGDPNHLNYDNCSNVWYWGWRRTAYQIKHIGDLFRTIFGNDNVGQWKRVRPILAGQVAYPFIIKLGLDYLNAVYGPPSNYLHGMAGAPYFNLGKYGSWSNLTTDQVLDAFNISIQEMSPEAGWGQNQAVGAHGVYSAWFKLPMYGYEGGSDTSGSCGDCSIEAKINATRDPRMADICVTYLNAWYRYGFQELNWFGAGANEIGKYGSWGLLEDMRQETLIDTTTMFNSTSPVAKLPRPSPKLKAVDQVRQSSVQFNFGFPVPSLNINATNFAEHRVPYPDPVLRYLGVNSTFYYPLQVHQSPIKINVTVYTSGDSGVLECAINNEQFIEVQTPKTVNDTTFAATPVMQFNVVQTSVPSVAGFRLRVVQPGYDIRSFDVVIATD